MSSLNFSKINVNSKIKWGLGISLFILLVSSLISYYSIRKLIEQQGLVDHTNKIILNLENIISHMKDAETSQRGYLLTGDKKFLEPYIGARERVTGFYNEVRELTDDNTVQQMYLDTLKPLLDERFDRLAEVLRIKAVNGTIAVGDMDAGRVLMARIRTVIKAMQTEETILLNVRTRQTDMYAGVSPLIIGISSLLSLIVAATSLYFITRDITIKEKTQKELARFNYLLSATAELNDLLRSEKQLDIAGDKIISHLCRFMKAQMGVLYIQGDDQRFHRTNTYGFEPDENIPVSFRSGEGLHGQSALDKQTLIIDNISDGVKIRSGLTLINPANIIIVPFYYRDNTVAVAELISKSPFEELDLEFINSVGNSISIFINGLKSELKTIELLSETQNQAEELESQQEELRQMNDELREQRDRLQASEEELKASEEELQEKNTELEQQYESLRIKNKDLEDARQAVQLKVNQVETVSNYKSDFLANMSHELRTPLNSILILAALLKENRSKNLSKKETEQASIIEKSGNDLLKLINEILDLSRVESGKLKLELNEYSIQDFSQENQFREFAKEKKINFKVIIEDNVPKTIFTDRFRVEQVLRNLLSNAFKFTQEGGNVMYRIHLADENKHFKHPALQNNKVIAFSVKDNGIGIREDMKDLIFEAFQQADPSTTRKYGGSGLGLTISRDIAQLLGGEIHVSSEEGKGSEFTVYLPERLEEVVSYPVIPKQETEVRSGAEIIPLADAVKITGSPEENTILIIEDDVYFSNILTEYSVNKGYQVKVAHTGREGLAMARKNSLTAILLDVQLPDMNGWDLLKKIKHIPGLKDVPVHMMSAYDREGLTKELGQEDFITKPMTLEKLDKAFDNISRKNKLKHILIVEDNETENLAVQELLRTHGMEASNAFTGKQAMEMLKEKRYDCVILDISLPDRNGYEIVEEIRKNADLKTIPVIIYSGKDLSEEEEAKLKKYADTIIIKTEYSYSRLLEEVKLFMHNVGSSLSKSTKAVHGKKDMILQDKKVLIADDDMRNIFSLSGVLEDQGMRIIVAYDGKQAVQELEANPDTDIILMDIMMPEMDGIEATRHIRSKTEFHNVPIIAVTAKAMEGDKEKCLAAGVSDYVSKPIDINKLLSLMRVWIYKS